MQPRAVKSLLEKLCLNQLQLAAVMGVHVTTIQTWMRRGPKPMHSAVLGIMAEFAEKPETAAWLRCEIVRIGRDFQVPAARCRELLATLARADGKKLKLP